MSKSAISVGSGRSEGRVVVLGGSMGGLLAARVLSEHARSVVVVERDALPARDDGRKGVPQGRHAHGLLGRGQQIIESLFPGIGAELTEDGAVFRDLGNQRWVLRGRPIALPPHVGTTAFTCTRPVLECRVRARVRAVPNIALRGETDVVGVEAEDGRVTGVRVVPRTDGAASEVLPADLVVDATGRGSRLPRWLRALGYPEPREEHVRVGMRYATVIARRSPRHAGGSPCVVVAATPPNRRCGVALAIDAERWIITLPGYLGEAAGRTWDDLVEFARGLPAVDLHTLMRDSEPLSEVITATFPHSQRRHYDRLRRHPAGIVAFGDAICSFNPAFGQGMTVAACEAMELDKIARRRPLPELWRPFYRRARPIVDVPWSITVGNDLRFPEVEGRRGLSGRLLGAYLDRLLQVAAVDPVVGAAFLRVTHLLQPPHTLMHPSIMWRVARGPQPRRARVALSGAPTP